MPGDVREAARQPADRGLRDPVRFGVVRFPGSCDEVDALRGGAPRRRGGTAVARRRGSARGRRRDHPRRVLLRRPPAGRRDRALRARDGRGRALRAPRRARARHLQRLPGAVRGRAAAGRAAAQHEPEVHLPAGRAGGRQRVDLLDGRVLGRRDALDPRQAHDRPLLRARSGARRARGQRPGRAALPRRRELQRLLARHRGRLEQGRQRGRADAASGARGRRADRLRGRAEAVRVGGAGARA